MPPRPARSFSASCGGSRAGLWPSRRDRHRSASVRRQPERDDRLQPKRSACPDLNNRVPGAVLALEVVGAAPVALGLLAAYLAMMGRGVVPVVLAAALVSMMLLITFDLDRPTRGLITVPDTALVNVRLMMVPAPAATGPAEPKLPP